MSTVLWFQKGVAHRVDGAKGYDQCTHVFLDIVAYGELFRTKEDEWCLLELF